MSKTMKRPVQKGGPIGKSVVPWEAGFEYGFVAETITVGADASVTLAEKIPPYSEALWCQVKCAAAGTITTGTVFLFGISGNTDNFADITFTAIDAVGDIYLAPVDEALVTTSSAQAVQIASDSGNLTTGTWDVCVWYRRFLPFETAS